MEALVENNGIKNGKAHILMCKQVVIDYDAPIQQVEVFGVKYISDDVLKTKLNMTGIGEKVELTLFDLGPRISHDKAKTVIKSHGIEPAGLHETFHFTRFLHELPDQEFNVTALRDEMVDRYVEFVPTIYSPGKNKARIIMAFRDDLPFKHSYFLGVKKL